MSKPKQDEPAGEGKSNEQGQEHAGKPENDSERVVDEKFDDAAKASGAEGEVEVHVGAVEPQNDKATEQNADHVATAETNPAEKAGSVVEPQNDRATEQNADDVATAETNPGLSSTKYIASVPEKAGGVVKRKPKIPVGRIMNTTARKFASSWFRKGSIEDGWAES